MSFIDPPEGLFNHRRRAAPAGGGGVTDHGALTGLSDDDHPQYPLKSIATTKGDLLAASASATLIRLGIGTNGQVLTADSAEATGMKWATPASGSQTPWTSDIDADAFDLIDLGSILIGASAPLASNGLIGIDLDRTTTTGQSLAQMEVRSTTTFNTTAGGNLYGLYMLPIISGDANINTVAGLLFQPTMNPAVTITNAYGVYAALQHGIGTLTTGTAIYARVTEALGTLSTGIGVDVTSANTAGTFTTMIGLRVTGLAGGTTKWGMQVGDYQSYHHGKLALGGTSAPTYGLELQGTAQDRGVIALAESAATPTSPTASGQCVLYMKSDKLVVGYLDGATMRYKYLDLTGTGVTWIHTTVAP